MSFYHGSMVRFGKSNAKFTGLPGGINRYARQRCFSTWMPRESTIVVGAVSYCDSVSSIWEGMKLSFSRRGVELDFILFTTYERQLEYLLSGHIDIAWNGPVAHARLQKLAGNSVSLGMRDVDRDFASCVISTKKSGIKCMKDIENKRLATGSYDSPQAYILPMQHLIHGKVDLSTVEVLRFDKDIGKHGDTAIGEIKVIEALRNGLCDAGFVSKMMLDRRDMSMPGEEQLNLDDIIDIPVFHHCQFDSLLSVSQDKRDRFQKALFDMDWNNEEDREVMKAEGIKEKWMPCDEEGYATVRSAVSTEETTISPTPYSNDKNPFKSLSVYT